MNATPAKHGIAVNNEAPQNAALCVSASGSTSMTLEQYLKTNCERQVIDHSIRAEIGKDGCPRFYIHPAGVSGETLDFVVTKNQLHPVKIWDGMQLLASENPIPPDIRAKMDADRAQAEMSNDAGKRPRI